MSDYQDYLSLDAGYLLTVQAEPTLPHCFFLVCILLLGWSTSSHEWALLFSTTPSLALLLHHLLYMWVSPTISGRVSTGGAKSADDVRAPYLRGTRYTSQIL